MSVIASCSITVSIERIVESTHRFYKLQSSTAAAPAKPTSIDTLPPTGWADVEPAYTEGSTSSLYTVDLTVFSDGTFSYTDVSLSSSYEAAKSAYNKAQAAQDTAEAVEQKIPGINLSPFFSHDLDDLYNANTNPSGYWHYLQIKNNCSITQLPDGWVHVSMDNSSGTGFIRNDCYIMKDDAFAPSTDYTFLFEFKNRVSATTGNGDCYVVQGSGGCQFWGSSIKKNLEGNGTTSSTTFCSSVPTDGSVYTKRFVKTSEAANSSNRTANPTHLVTIVFRASAGEVIEFDFRASIYKGEYYGPYMPFVLSDATYIKWLAEAAAEVAENIKIYSIEPSVSRIKKDWYYGTLDPTTIRFNAYCNGESYTGGHMYVESRSGDTWTSVIDGTGGAIVHTVRADAEEIRCRLTTTDTEPVELASILIPVIIDMSQVTQEQIFNKLTNNGVVQGLIMHNGQCYINAAYLNIGYGTNIYENYDTLLNITNSTLYWKSSGISACGVINSGVNGYKAFYISVASGNNGYIFLGNSANGNGAIKVTSGKMYRISFYARNASGSGRMKLWAANMASYGDSSPSLTGIKEFATTSTWTRYEANYTATTAYLGLGFANIVISTRLEVSCIMVELVDSASDATSPFTPAGSTQIDGGMIKTKSIQADAINVSDLHALGATIGGWQIEDGYLQSTNGNIKLYPDGRVVIGNATLSAISNAFTVKYGLHVWTDTSTISDDSGAFKLMGLSSASGSTLVRGSDNIVSLSSSSSKRYKDPCGMATLDEAEKLLNLPVVRFRYKDGYLRKGDQMEGKEMPGFYAEEVAELIPEAAIYDAEGRPEDWNHRILIPIMLKLIQGQRERIKSLEDRLDKIESLLSGNRR